MMKNKKSLTFSWNFLGWFFLALLLAFVIIVLIFPGVAEGFDKGIDYLRNLI